MSSLDRNVISADSDRERQRVYKSVCQESGGLGFIL